MSGNTSASTLFSSASLDEVFTESSKFALLEDPVAIDSSFEVPDANTLPRWKPPWGRSPKLGQEWWLFLLALLRFLGHQHVLI